MIPGLLVALAFAVTIRSDFEGGSIGPVEQVAPDHFRCGVRGEVDQDRRNRQASWYYFRVNGTAGREITIDLVDLLGEYNYKPGNLAINAATRPWISYDRETWTLLAGTDIEWHEKGPMLRMRLTPERSPVWVAHHPPYTGEHLDRLLAHVRRSPSAEVAEAGKSPAGRGIALVTVPNRSRPDAGKKVVWIMARQHAWESGTSWVLDGALRHVLKPETAGLRDSFIFRFFPMADPDGVARGGVRFNAQGYDVNRNWDIADPKRMPEISALRKAVLDWIDGGRRIDLFLSLHNTNSDYLEGPLSAAGPGYREMIHRLAGALAKDTIFHGKAPRDWPPGEVAPGRMDACKGLFHDRGIPTLLLEQNAQRGTGIEGYRRFGEQLIVALAASVAGRARSERRPLGTEPPGSQLWAPGEVLQNPARGLALLLLPTGGERDRRSLYIHEALSNSQAPLGARK